MTLGNLGTLLVVGWLGCWSAQAQSLYGPALQADSLANTPLGKGGIQVSCRFRAVPGGELRSIRPFLIWSFRKQGYHAGSGGTLKVELQTDDGSAAHLPSGQVLATHTQPMALRASSDQFYPLLYFDRGPVLKAGVLYHLVFSNVHPDPEHQYLSLNALFNQVAGSPQQPRLPEEDWAMLYRSRPRPAWVPRRTPGSKESFTPILEVSYASGQSQGVGYIEFWMGAPKPIQPGASVRETFTVSGPARRVAAIALRVRRLAGTAPLVARLEQADGKLLAEVQAQGASVPLSASGALGGCAWVHFPLAAQATLLAGHTYQLVFSTAGPGRYETFPMRKGSDKGFSAATLFPDGHAEFNDGRGWKGWEQWGKGGLVNGDLQFYFQCR